MDVNEFMQQMILAGAGGNLRSSMGEDEVEELQLLLKGELFQKLEAANRLCTFYSMIQHSMGARINHFGPILVGLFESESNIDLLILLARCFTNMVDAVPECGHLLIKEGLLSTINEKLLNIEYIDLAEQCIRCVDTMAQDFRAHVLQSGILPSAMTYIDFHAISVQRKILHIASLLTKGVHSENFSVVKSILPQLCNYMTSDDKQMSEYACTSVANIILGIEDDLELVEELCSSSQIVNQYISLLSSKRFLTNSSKSVIVFIFSSLRVLAQYSITAFEKLHQQEIGNILCEVISLNREFAGDCTRILVQLLPPTNERYQITSEMSHTRREGLLQEHVLADIQRKQASSVDSCDPNIEFFEKHPEVFQSFASLVLPLMLETFSSATDAADKLRCLSGIASVINFASADVLKEMLRCIPISTFLADLLSSNHLIFVTTAIQICKVLISKLPDIFKVYFVREGVLSELEKISGVSSSQIENKKETILSKLRQQAQHSERQVSQTPTRNSRSLAQTSTTTTTSIPTTRSASKKSSKVQSPTKGKLMSFLSRKKKTSSPTSSSSSASKPSTTRADSSPSSASQSSPLSIRIPRESRLSPHKSKVSALKSTELRDVCVVLADEIQKLYFADGSTTSESAFSKELNQLGDMLLAAKDPEEEQHHLMLIRDLLNVGKNNEKVTNFEFLGSNTVAALLEYLKRADINRLANFLIVFNRSLTMSPSMLASSPHRKAITADSHFSHLRELIHRLQDCLSSEESLPIFEDAGDYGAVQSLRELSRPIKILLQSVRKTKNSVMVEMRVNPMAPVSAVLAQLERLVAEKSSKKPPADTPPTVIMSDESDDETTLERREDYFHTQEEDDEDEEMRTPRVVDLGQPSIDSDAHKGKYDFLSEELNETASTKKSYKYELYMEGSDLAMDSDAPVFRAIIMSSSKKKRHPSQSKIWSKRHIMKYKRRKSIKTEVEDNKKRYLQSRVVRLIEQTNSIHEASPLSSQNSLVLSILQLLSIIDILNRHASEILPHTSSHSLIPRSEFVNHKISSKVQKQVSDPFVILSALTPEWVFFLCTQCKFLFSFNVRNNFFALTSLGVGRSLTTLQQRNDRLRRREPRIQLTHQKIRVPRDEVFEKAYLFFMRENSSILSRFEVEFYGEAGTGHGPTNEFFALISDHLKKADLNIWLNSDSDAEFVHSSSGLYPKCIDPNNEQRLGFYRNVFRFIGKYIARAVMDDRLIDMPLSFALLKALKGEPLFFDDIRYIDPQIYDSLRKFYTVVQAKKQIEKSQELAASEKKGQIYELTLDGVRIEDLTQTFTLIGTDIELMDGGSDIDVTIWNLEDFLEMTADWLLRIGVKEQVESLREGFSALVHPKNLFLFSHGELETLFAGEDKKWTEGMLKKAIVCDHGYTPESQTIVHLMHVLTQFDQPQRRAFVRFVTGSPRLPVGGLQKLNPKLTVVRKSTGDAGADSYLPSCMTCTHYLKLPSYSSVGVLKEQLEKAIREGQGAFHLS
eukprot:CAMPEP_0117439754 /NCGR_PEP_ID=MMETSP0759-20121206/2726_1 /TAXON_ID=63605 /ORGANISM="Percolomonas cosmopolitus, Strain WS" /LENGTH=1495 /DNA_ID=CAMNT_0005231475 /DNA_START=707 /DNA_END=5194 /DNA_ORIENTATION=-